ncbi:hypothetical protein F8388_017928 [Cannabis sativa]|uniref:RNase H type-1 domain-containing protein n=1 Tax=Cannabis sativa TaxID=3483 RepID=A0A7J6HGC9_CANSA|nr:hypothetical protein F8388_017928 [Cannabis sativa]
MGGITGSRVGASGACSAGWGSVGRDVGLVETAPAAVLLLDSWVPHIDISKAGNGHPPRDGWDIHFKVDASIKDGEDGIGALQCDVDDEIAVVLLQFFKGVSVLKAELLAIHSAMNFASQAGYVVVLIESYSACKELPYAWGLIQFFYECLSLFSKFVCCSVVFVPRSKNSVANSLARCARVLRCCKRTILREVGPLVTTT